MTDRETLEIVREHAWRFGASPAEAPGLILETAANARLVLIGEASHGTHEFSRMRAELTRSLIEHHGFTLVSVEGPRAAGAVVARRSRYLRDLSVGGVRRQHGT
jgi:erythromycin esterase-like protein